MTFKNVSQVIAGPNEHQQQNVALVNATFSICQMLSAILSDQREYFSESAKQTIISTVDSCEQLMETILEPAFSAVADAIEVRILEITVSLLRSFLSNRKFV